MSERVTKDMSIVSILSRYPLAREVFKKHGIQFIGKQLSPLESLEVVAKGNNLSDQAVQEILRDIRDGLEKQQSELFSGELLILRKETADYLRTLLSSKKGKKGFRLRLASDGCGLYSYDLDFATKQLSGELSFHAQGITFYIEKKTLGLIKGTTLEFRDGGIYFDNPNVAS